MSYQGSCKDIEVVNATFCSNLTLAICTMRSYIPHGAFFSRSNSLSEAHVQVTEPALLSVLIQYTREASVRALKRAISGIGYFEKFTFTDRKVQKSRLVIISTLALV